MSTNPFEDKRPVTISAGDLISLYAAICTGSFCPSMFDDVKRLMKVIDSKLGELNENKSSESANNSRL